jgi:hypothetical protein
LKGRFWGGGGGRPGGGRRGSGEGWGWGGETEVAGVEVEDEDLFLLEDGVMVAMLGIVWSLNSRLFVDAETWAGMAMLCGGRCAWCWELALDG